MIGTRNIAFPRLNAFSYWIYLFGGAAAVDRASSLNIGPDARLVRVPAARRARVLARQARRRLGADDHLHRGRGARGRGRRSSPPSSSMRAPGMTLARMPLFVWAMLVTSFMIIFAMPSVMLATSMLITRPAGRHALLQPRRGRRRAAVAAPVLVLRPPRGLHHLHPGAGLRLGDHRDLLAAAGLRLHGDGAVADRHRLPRLRPVGAPHVRDRPAASSARASSPRPA